MSPGPTTLERLGVACAAFGVVTALAELGLAEAAAPTPQALANLHFAANPSWLEALDRYPRVWPPLYPSLAWLAARLGMPAVALGGALFLASLPLVGLASRRVAPGLPPGFAVGLYALCAFHVENLGQAVSEALLVPLGLATFVLLGREGPRGKGTVAGLCALVMAACLTRYFAIVWLLPAAAVVIALWARAAGASPLAAGARGAAFGLVALAPVGAWMLAASARTGYLTGMDRFGPRLEALYTDLPGNLLFTLRTLRLDWLAPGGGAGRGAVGAGWDPTGLDLALAVFAGLLLLGLVAAWLPSGRAEGRARAGGALLAWFSLGNLALVVALWTAGNNDPIYSRFLYPAYAFLLLGVLHLHAGVLATGARGWRRIPAPALLATVAAVQLARGAQLVGGPA